MSQTVTLLARRRRELLQGLADSWTGTVNDFMAAHKLTRVRYDAMGLKIKGR
jgi:hypothetical protein